MSLKSIAVVYRKELRDLLRDRRTLRSMVVFPLLMMPLMIVGLGKVTRVVDARARAEIPAIQIQGGEDSPGVLARLRSDNKLRIEPSTADWRRSSQTRK